MYQAVTQRGKGFLQEKGCSRRIHHSCSENELPVIAELLPVGKEGLSPADAKLGLAKLGLANLGSANLGSSPQEPEGFSRGAHL